MIGVSLDVAFLHSFGMFVFRGPGNQGPHISALAMLTAKKRQPRLIMASKWLDFEYFFVLRLGELSVGIYEVPGCQVRGCVLGA